MPHLTGLLAGQRLVTGAAPLETARATVVALDACLGVPGLPQSASGQAALLTGQNVPALIGMHYGPWPSPAIVKLLAADNLFYSAQRAGKAAALLNAYPPSYFAAVASGRRLYSVIPQAVTSAGIPLKAAADLRAGRALSADFTGQGWHDRLGLYDTPLLTPAAAGARLAALASTLDLAFFEYWASDYAGHSQNMAVALELLATFDDMLGGLLAAWDDAAGLILITSDHGNLENLVVRGHTANPVPALLIGAPAQRRDLAAALRSLPDVTPALMRLLAQ